MELEHHKESLEHWSEDEWEEEDEVLSIIHGIITMIIDYIQIDYQVQQAATEKWTNYT